MAQVTREIELGNKTSFASGDFVRGTNSSGGFKVPQSDFETYIQGLITIPTIPTTSAKIKIVSGTPGAGEIQWTGSGPYTVTGWDSGLSGDATDVVIQFFNADFEPITPLAPDLSDLSSITFNSNTDDDLYVKIVRVAP